MMKVKFVIPKLKSGKEYKGQIRRYTVDEERKIFRIFVVLDKVPELEYMKKFDYDLNARSELGEFCDNMLVLSEDGLVDFDELEGLPVIVKLKKGTTGKLYINEIWLDEEIFEQGESDFDEE